jgi:hypothetical protein
VTRLLRRWGPHAALLALLALVYVLAGGWRRYLVVLPAAARLAEPTPLRPAHEIALEKLDALVRDDLLRRGQHHEYFRCISETLREYAGNRYGFFALDLTSRELCEELRDRVTPGLDLGLLDQILRQADLVKFAREKPSDEECSRAINGAFAIIEQTRAPFEPAGASIPSEAG